MSCKFIKEKIRKENVDEDGWHVIHSNILKK